MHRIFHVNRCRHSRSSRDPKTESERPTSLGKTHIAYDEINCEMGLVVRISCTDMGAGVRVSFAGRVLSSSRDTRRACPGMSRQTTLPTSFGPTGLVLYLPSTRVIQRVLDCNKTKIMFLIERNGLQLAAEIASERPQEVTLFESLLEERVVRRKLRRLI